MRTTRTVKKRMSVLVLGVCLLVSLALGGVAAWAKSSAGWISPDSTGVGSNSITTNTSANSESYADDLAKADVVIDVYKVATATGTLGYDDYQLVLDDEYNTPENNQLLIEAQKGTSGAWEELADRFAENAELHEGGTAAIGETVSGLEDGLYLVLAHGANITDSMRARSKAYEYSFSPIIVAAPTKDPVNGIINAANPGEIKHDINIGLKSQRRTLYGALEITKTVTEAADEDSTFVFHLTGTTPAGEAYDNYASVTIPAGELTGTTIVTHIPADTEITITEVYASRYNIGEVTPSSGIVVADSEDGTHNLISFACENEPGDDKVGGHGVENNYEFNKKGNGDWDWTPTPADKAPDYEE